MNKNIENQNVVNSDMTINCGKESDTMETLAELCRVEAAKVAATIDVPDGKIVAVPFWTSDFPELICVGKFRKEESGNVVFELDFSESTL